MTDHPEKIGRLSILSLGILVGFAAVSSQSLWIDEANSAIKAITPNWQAFVSLMAVEKGSDLQMPLYMVLLWLWEKVTGPSEFALRSLNILLFVLAIAWTACRTQVSKATRIWFVGLACVSPMVWTYLNEARPYILQFLGAALLMSALVNLTGRGRNVSPKTSNAVVAAIGAFILCGASLLGVIFTFFFGIAFSVLWLKAERLGTTLRRPAFQVLFVIVGLLFAGLGVYYVWTLSLGAGASNIGRTNAFSLMFCGYEFFGFTGVGPGRTDLRIAGGKALVRHARELLAYSIAWCLWVLACWPVIGRRTLLDIKKFNIILGAVVLCLTTIIVLGVVANFRILGRHLIPLLPFALLSVAAISSEAFASASPVQRLGILFLPIAMLTSSLFLRFSPIHAKDDYRGAASVAAHFLQQGKVVWWAADGAGANYYSLHPITLEGTASSSGNNLFFANSRSADYLQSLPVPNLVILSKTDIYDAKGTLRNYLERGQFQILQRLSAMTLWVSASEKSLPEGFHYQQL